MKKLLSVLLALSMVCSFAACSSSESSQTSATTASSQSETVAETSVPTEKLEWVDYAEYNLEEDVPAKNVILMIGDGMGKEIIKGSQVVKGD